MTFEEAKKILEKEGFVLERFQGVLIEDVKTASWEKIAVSEAMKVVAENGYFPLMEESKYKERKARLEKEYEKNTKAPDSAKNCIKEDSVVINPAIKESASQFNDALLDEQAKEIKRLKKKNAELLGIVKRMKQDVKEVDYKFNVVCKENERLNEKIRELTKEKLNLEDQITILNACKKHNDKIDRKQIKGLGKEIAKLNGIIHDKNAILSDVAEELRLTKIREKNLVEVSQKYMKENEELKKELADKVVDKIDTQALKSAESALAYKEKVIADLGKKLKAQKDLVDDISLKYDGAKYNLKLRIEECEKLKKELDKMITLVDAVRNSSKEYCDYGVAANEFIKELAHLYVLASNNGIINIEMLERCKNYQTYGFPANCNRETKKEINDIARGKKNKKPRIPTPELSEEELMKLQEKVCADIIADDAFEKWLLFGKIIIKSEK